MDPVTLNYVLAIAFSAASALLLLAGLGVLGGPFSKKTKNGDSAFQETQVIIRQIRKTILDQVLNHNAKLFAGIAKQKIVLNDQGRPCIAIFLSPDMFKELLFQANAGDTDQIEKLYAIMLDLGAPVGFLGDLPIYISEFLTDAPVFVVGGIRWEL